MKALNELRDEAFRIAREHGFKDASVPEDFMLMVSEIAEALEDHREGKLPHEMYYEDSGGTKFGSIEQARKLSMNADDVRGFKPCGIPSEMADVIIRVLHFCGKHGIDIESAVAEKMVYNDKRPFKHGKVI
jgi:NTP pyrophosphatase (non-canonical NTP hydrolase)